MAGVQGWELAVAVSEAGGLGSIPCGMLSPEQISEEISLYKRHSAQPFNLNFFCHQMPEKNSSQLSAWEFKLSAYYHSLGVSPTPAVSNLRLPFDDGVADLLEPFEPPVISFHFGLPSPLLVERIKAWGTIILSSATTLEEGLWLEEHGVDIVVAQGLEAGGHRAMFLTADSASQMNTTLLLGELLNTLKVPVIAAGGIASHAGVKSMLLLGASGVQVGTSYLLCDEAKTSQVHREALQDIDRTTAITNLFSGRLARGIQNKFMNDFGPVSSEVPDFPFASIALGPLRSRAESLGLSDFTPLWSGEDRSGCKEVSAKTMTNYLWMGE
ncbi:UNVERIFIED_CONTAM: hypothetical protein GTU68_034828 [Idotea baltica]|nr:hypothetical protein [Idotea baltica]